MSNTGACEESHSKSGMARYVLRMTSLLEEREKARRALAERERLAVRERLRHALRTECPGHVVWLYGSITQPGRFREWSDIDLALENEPAGGSLWRLMSLLSEHTGRSVDLCVLEETRLREKILREGERWIA